MVFFFRPKIGRTVCEPGEDFLVNGLGILVNGLGILELIMWIAKHVFTGSWKNMRKSKTFL